MKQDGWIGESIEGVQVEIRDCDTDAAADLDHGNTLNCFKYAIRNLVMDTYSIVKGDVEDWDADWIAEVRANTKVVARLLDAYRTMLAEGKRNG